MKSINNFLNQNINKIILVFIFLQPFLDVIAGISLNYFHISLTFSSIVRLIFMFLCFYYIIIIGSSKNKKLLILIISYFLCFIFTILLIKGHNAFYYEFKNLINTFYFPIVLLGLSEIFKNFKFTYLKKIIIVYFIYILFLIIPNIFNIGFMSYSESKLGNVGWFISANSVGNILSIILPFVFYYLIKYQKNIFIRLITMVSILYAFFSMGTKVPILSFILCIIINFIYFIFYSVNNKKYRNIVISFIISIVCLLSAYYIVPKTSFYKNLEIHKNYLGLNSYVDVFKDSRLIDHFIFSQRLTFLNNTNKNYLSSSNIEKVFGIGYIENYGKDNVSLKTIEIDYFDILYRHGIGFIVYFLIVIPYFVDIFKLKTKSLYNLELKISVMLILILSLFSGHVLLSPSVSIFASLILIQGGSYEKIN